MPTLPTRPEVYDRFLGRFDEVDAVCAFFATAIAASRRPLADVPRVLDVGCGTGRLLPALQARGWQVEGLEPDAEYRHAAMRRAPGVAMRPERMENLAAPGMYDLIALVNGPLGYLTDGAVRARALAQARTALLPGGCVVIDLPDFAYIRAHYTPPSQQSTCFGDVVVTRTPRHCFDQPGVWLHIDVVERSWPGGSDSWEEVVPLAMIDATELAHELNSAGFREVCRWPLWTSTFPMAMVSEAGVGPRLLLTARR